MVIIEAKNLPVAEFADSDLIKVGQWAIAVGSPFSLKNTVTVGVVSAIRKETDPNEPLPYAEAIQTDASINPGNSGGPLVDINGKIIGINGAIYSQSGGNIGIGFAIPSNTAKFVMSNLISKGKVVRGQLGIVPRDISIGLAPILGVSKGALVDSVDPDSAAAKAGIKPKDVIVKINGKEIANAVDLRHTIEVIEPGSKVNVVVVRDKKSKNLTVVLDESVDVGIESNADESVQIGLNVIPLTTELSNQLRIPAGIKGVVVRSVNQSGPAATSGIRQGDVITEINNIPITSVASYTKAINALKAGDTVIVVVQRQDRSSIIELRLD